MKNATKRAILRWIHLIFTIPVLGYIYQPASQVEQYDGAARFIFVPVLILSGYWMYAGMIFAMISVAAWLATFRFVGFGPALLTQVLLLVCRKIWLMMRARQPKGANP
jgi:hypothetical protein